MADLNETVAAVDEFDAWVQGIYQLEQEDLVLGGADGIDNLQAKQLLARSNWLKAQVLGLGAGKQPLDAMLTALSALVTEADQTLYFTGPDTPALTALTAYARTLIAAADAAAARATLGAASPADIAAAIAALVNSSPATLDTLNELAAAIGNDANFATTITNALALKAPWTALDEVIAAAGIGVDHGVVTQLRDAILGLIAASQNPGVETGLIIYVPANAAPTGYLKANGALVSRTTYAALWAYAQASGNLAASDGAWVAGQFSPGDGSTTFRIPDGRGEFVRGWDDGRGVDSGRAIGTAQGDAVKAHTHTGGVSGSAGYTAGGATSAYVTPGAATGSTGDTETRSRNIAWLACIKY